MNTGWKILIVLGIFLAVFTGISLVTMRVQPENKVEAYKKLLREQGEKLELSEVLPPPVPAESNSVNAVVDAFGMFGSGNENIPDAMKMVAPGKALVGWRQPEARGYDFTNSWDDFAVGVAVNRPALELLHQVLERPRLDFQLDYKQGATLLLPHLAPMKRAAQKLLAASVLDLHNGDSGAATTNILTLLGLAQRNASEGLLISHLVRIAITSIAVTPTWELLQTTNVTDAQLAAVQKGWEQLDFFCDAAYAFQMERAWAVNEIAKMRASHEGYAATYGMSASLSGSGSSASVWSWPPDWEGITERPRYAVGEIMWRSSWSYSDELRTLKCDQIILETLRTMRTNQSQYYQADYDAMTSRLSSIGITNAGAALFRSLKIPDFSEIFGDWGMGSAVRKTLQMETARRVVVTAVALKRSLLKHGKLPGTPDELVPEFIPAVPIDPCDGKLLRYHPHADGMYLLYSVGLDGKDDGGDPTPLKPASSSSTANWNWLRGHDWVWPQPATVAEVQFFYNHPPK